MTSFSTSVRFDDSVGHLEEVGQDDDGDDGEEITEKGQKQKTKTKKGERQNKVPRKLLFDAFNKCLSEVHEIKNLKDKKTEVKGVPFKNVQIVAEKAHNKFITTIAGLEPFQIDLEKLSSFFQNKFATSSTISDLPGKNAGKVMVV